DQETGLPVHIPPRVRLAWLMTTVEEQPPPGIDLVFRIRRLRHQSTSHLNGARVCPAEDGQPRAQPVTCDHCRICWQPLPVTTDATDSGAQPPSRRTSLPLLNSPPSLRSADEGSP